MKRVTSQIWSSLTKPTISSSLKKKGKDDENSPVKWPVGIAASSLCKKSPLPFKKLDFNVNRKQSLPQKII